MQLIANENQKISEWASCQYFSPMATSPALSEVCRSSLALNHLALYLKIAPPPHYYQLMRKCCFLPAWNHPSTGRAWAAVITAGFYSVVSLTDVEKRACDLDDDEIFMAFLIRLLPPPPHAIFAIPSFSVVMSNMSWKAIELYHFLFEVEMGRNRGTQKSITCGQRQLNVIWGGGACSIQRTGSPWWHWTAHGDPWVGRRGLDHKALQMVPRGVGAWQWGEGEHALYGNDLQLQVQSRSKLDDHCGTRHEACGVNESTQC